jgi:1-acyl-sn-glycerol-3-phosphate acyltransferase
MKKPAIKLENYENIYEYYKDHKQNYSFARLGHAAMAAVFRPRVEYASDVKETVGRLLEQGKQLIIASNHVTGDDQYVVAAMAQREKALHQMRGKTFIPSKEPLFRNPLLRRAVDGMGAIPTFRSKDIEDPTLSPEEAELKKQTRRSAAKMLIDTAIYKMQRGEHMSIFPEGTRNPEQPKQVQDLMPGIGIIACGASEAVDVSILPTALYYGADRENRFTPKVYIGDIIHGPFDDPNEVLHRTHEGMQSALDEVAA